MKAPLSEAELDDAEDKLRKLYAGESDGGYLPDGLLSRLIAEIRALREAVRPIVDNVCPGIEVRVPGYVINRFRDLLPPD